MVLSSPKEGMKNSFHYYCALSDDRRRRRSQWFSFGVILLCIGLAIYWLHYRRRTIIQRLDIIRNENRKLLPEALNWNIGGKMGRMAHGRDQEGLVITNGQAKYDSQAMRAFIIGILGSHQPLSENELDGVVNWLTRDVPELVPHRRVENPTPCWIKDNNNYICLPKAYVLGFKRSAWNDLYYRLASHPEVLQSWRVEEKFFARQKPNNFQEIVNNYGVNVQVGGYFKTGMLLEGNPDNFFFAADPSLAEIDMPRSLLVAQIIRRLTPNAKLIVILRNPVEAALSYYVQRRRYKRDTKHDFHRYIESLINEVHNMTYNNGLDICYGKGHLHENLLYWTYIVYLQDYLSVFPEENVYFIRMEDYTDKGRREEILEELFEFLEVSPMDFESLKYLAGMDPVDDESKRMFTTRLLDINKNTTDMVRAFFEPFNEILAETLNDQRFLWPAEVPVDHVENDLIALESLIKLN